MRTALPVLQGADDEWYSPVFPRGDLAAQITLEVHGPGGSPRAMAGRTWSTGTGVPAQSVAGIQGLVPRSFTVTDGGVGFDLLPSVPERRRHGTQRHGSGVQCSRN